MKIFDNTERGIVIESASCLNVGDTDVTIQESLLSMPGATFGNRLVHADLGKFSEGGLCLHAIADHKQADHWALVRVRLGAAAHGRQSYKMLGFENLAEVVIWQSRVRQEMVESVDLCHLYNRREMHALVVLQPRGTVSFLDAVKASPKLSLLRLIGKPPKHPNRELVTEHRLSYDGNEVTLRKLYYGMLNPDA